MAFATYFQKSIMKTYNALFGYSDDTRTNTLTTTKERQITISLKSAQQYIHTDTWKIITKKSEKSANDQRVLYKSEQWLTDGVPSKNGVWLYMNEFRVWVEILWVQIFSSTRDCLKKRYVIQQLQKNRFKKIFKTLMA